MFGSTLYFTPRYLLVDLVAGWMNIIGWPGFISLRFGGKESISVKGQGSPLFFGIGSKITVAEVIILG